MTAWYQSETVRGFDLETSGVDPFEARIVTAATVDIHPPGTGRRPTSTHWTLDPGTDIPDEATAVHGYTRDRVLEMVGGPGMALRNGNGQSTYMSVEAALAEIAGHVAMAMHREIPLVVANAPYDITLLEAELARYGIDSLASRPTGIRGVVDPMVIDRAFDQYRKACYKKAPDGTLCDQENSVHVCGGCRGGKHQCQPAPATTGNTKGCGVTDRKLESLCRHYGVPLVGAHDAAADALAAARLSVRLGGLWPGIARWKLGTLHEHQVTWRREQMDSLRAFFDRVGKEHDGCDPSWPVRPVSTGAAA